MRLEMKSFDRKNDENWAKFWLKNEQNWVENWQNQVKNRQRNCRQNCREIDANIIAETHESIIEHLKNVWEHLLDYFNEIVVIRSMNLSNNSSLRSICNESSDKLKEWQAIGQTLRLYTFSIIKTGTETCQARNNSITEEIDRRIFF